MKTIFFSKISGEALENFILNIVNPISGLMIGTRKEYAIQFDDSLPYQWDTVDGLPVILIPNAEPMPDNNNFYTYDQLAGRLSGGVYFNHLPIRAQSKSLPERLAI